MLRKVCRAQEDSAPNKGGASKRKLKKDRRAKRQELADEAQSECVTWDEDQASASRAMSRGGVAPRLGTLGCEAEVRG